MEVKALEVRDRSTFIPVLAVDMNAPPVGLRNHNAVKYLLRRCGYPCDGKPNIVLTRLSGNGQATNDPYAWACGSRTMPTAHQWIIENWASLHDGDVVDVEFILGETTEPKKSERLG